MNKKIFILSMLAVALITSCAKTEDPQNNDENIISDNQEINNEIQDTEGLLSNEIKISDINISEIITPVENIESETPISESTVFLPANIDATLSSIYEYTSETTATLYLNGYTPSFDSSSRVENDKNQVTLTWIRNKEIDIQNEFDRTFKDGYEYLDENQTYIYKDYKSLYGVMKKQIVWIDYGTLFTLTIPASLYTETSTVEMFEIEIAENIDIIENNEFTAETSGTITIEPDSVYINISDEPIEVEPIMPPEIANATVNP